MAMKSCANSLQHHNKMLCLLKILTEMSIIKDGLNLPKENGKLL
uniref:Uncharacterized protein n=1 Tax=Rhizophora mucronata TaxID=61149 RepID=A0A2P2MZ13_RHIMU